MHGVSTGSLSQSMESLPYSRYGLRFVLEGMAVPSGDTEAAFYDRQHIQVALRLESPKPSAQVRPRPSFSQLQASNWIVPSVLAWK